MWYTLAQKLPEHGQKIDWIAPDGTEVTGGQFLGVWMLPEGMYVYYTPAFWRPHQEMTVSRRTHPAS